jgi:hypothetical protein
MPTFNNKKTFQMPNRKRYLTQEEIFELINKSDSELSDLSDDNDAANKTYEPLLMEGQSSAEELDKENNANISNGVTM